MNAVEIAKTFRVGSGERKDDFELGVDSGGAVAALQCHGQRAGHIKLGIRSRSEHFVHFL